MLTRRELSDIYFIIHDFIVENVKYDKLKKAYSHEIIGALGNGVAVCEGIAKAVKILCDELNIWCIIALSEANPDKGIKYRHAWNVIKIGGQYYHLDATFDNTLSKDDTVRYDYVNLSDKQIFRDHEPVIWKIPACSDNDHFYYKEKKISWTTLDEVRNRTKFLSIDLRQYCEYGLKMESVKNRLKWKKLMRVRRISSKEQNIEYTNIWNKKV